MGPARIGRPGPRIGGRPGQNRTAWANSPGDIVAQWLDAGGSGGGPGLLNLCSLNRSKNNLFYYALAKKPP